MSTKKEYYIASVSWGKDSLYMLLWLIEEGAPLNEVAFYDTGMEFDAIYKTRDRVLPLLASRGIKYTELHPEMPFLYKMFELPVIRNKERKCDLCIHYKLLSLSWGYCNNPASKFYKTHDEDGGGLPSEKSPYSKGSCKLLELKRYTKYGYSWCGGRCRWGTTDKLKYLDRYAEDRKAEMYIGIAADETSRLEKERKPYKRFPLADWGVTEAEALQGCYAAGFHWEENGFRLYDLLDRVSCWCCANKNLKELKNIYTYLPEYWERLKDLQRRTCRPMKGEGKSVFDLEKRFSAEKITVTQPRNSYGWIRGTIGKHSFSAKVYDLPSTYGINNGRVSKLGIYNDEQRLRQQDYFASCIVNYSRGWDIRPKSKEERAIFKNVLAFLEALPLLEE